MAGSSHTRSSVSDPCERIIAQALTQAGFRYVHESEDKRQYLDFYVPALDVFIEVKQFSTPRTTGQIADKGNVILIQGRAGCEAFACLIAAAPELLSAAKAVLAGPFEREDSEWADALFACLEQAIDRAEGK